MTTPPLSELARTPEFKDIAKYANRFTVNVLPDFVKEYEYSDAIYYDIYVVYRGNGLWAVTNYSGKVYNKNGESEYEPQPSSRTDEFLAEYRHSLVDAIALAEEVANHVTVNKYSVESYTEYVREQIAAG
jgi:transglutaminase-like putative cysteine protease